MNVNLEQLHREEQNRLLNRRRGDSHDDDWSLQDKKRPPRIFDRNKLAQQQQVMSSGGEQSPYAHRQSRVLTKRDFKELFRYEENERDKKALKKDWKKLDKQFKAELKFKHIIDFYLGSSDQLASCLYDISAKKVLDCLNTSDDEGFNASIMRVLCLN